ncbi:MAG: DEAD/DEAH box helicase [Candidatus Gracilibacteria bacterium]|nr:DEAD/DEAH box helicase [Candidatus Gracilibacteria bacterium]
MTFEELNLKPEIMKSLESAGYTTPTQIQFDVIKEINNGKNIIGQSQTGTGKTAAFVISLLEKIDLGKRGVQALILAPTRELVNQTREEILLLSKNMNIKSLPVFGGSPLFKQKELIKKGQDIIIGTPGRVIDLIERGILKLDQIDFFVLDEVDRMLDMGFVDDIDYIWGKATNVKQSMVFSATITDDMKRIIEKYLGVDYTYIKSTNAITTEKIDHSFIEVPHVDKYEMLLKFIDEHKGQKTIVFCQTKRDTEVLADKLLDDDIKASFLNGDMRQRERFRALKDFQENKVDIFVVTDVAARGLNMKNIELVVNFDVPLDPESYIHRIGRTGRAGASGRAVMFVSDRERTALRSIEKTNKIKIKQIDIDGNEMERKEERSFGSRGGDSRGGRSSGGRFGGGRGGFRGSDRNSRGGRSFGSDRAGERAPRSGGNSYFGKSESSERTPRGEKIGFEKRFDRDSSSTGERKTFGDRSSNDFSRRDSANGERKNFADRGNSSFRGGERRSFGDRPSRDSGRDSGNGERRSFSDRTERNKERGTDSPSYFEKKEREGGKNPRSGGFRGSDRGGDRRSSGNNSRERRPR